MKIGQFAKETDVSVNTIRYYQDLGLIVPIKTGSQYDFDERCKKDLEDILTFKNMGFTLTEITSIFNFKRLGKLSDYQENGYYKQIFSNKYTDIIKEIDRLKNVKVVLESNMNKLDVNINKATAMIGIDLEVLPLLTCPKCGQTLSLEDGEIKSNQVMNGVLTCSCSEKYLIVDGILSMSGVDVKNNISTSLTDYLKETPGDYLNDIYKDIERNYKQIDFSTYQNKIILELNVGYGLFLRHIYDDIPDNTIYFAHDENFKRIKILKCFLEQTKQKKINFIHGDYLKIPLKRNTLDGLFDNFASSNYGFTNKEFLLEKLSSYLKPGGYLLGVFAIFKTFSSDNYILPECRRNFVLNNIKDYLNNLEFEKVYEVFSDYLTDSGKHDNYYNEDDRVYRYSFYGKK